MTDPVCAPHPTGHSFTTRIDPTKLCRIDVSHGESEDTQSLQVQSPGKQRAVGVEPSQVIQDKPDILNRIVESWLVTLNREVAVWGYSGNDLAVWKYRRSIWVIHGRHEISMTG